MADEDNYKKYISTLEIAQKIMLPSNMILPELQQKTQEDIINKVTTFQINSFLSKNEYTNAYDLFKKVKEEFPRYNLEGITQINENDLLIQKFYLSTMNRKDSDSFEEFIKKIGAKELLSKKDFNFSEIFEFGLHPGLILEEGDWGKCILYFDKKTGFRLNVSKIEDFNPKTLSKEKLRKLFEKGSFSTLTPYHKEHERPEGSRILGGGAYVMKGHKEIYIDSTSGDFGNMNRHLLEKCLKQGGLEGSFYGDDKYFDTTDIETYLKKILLTEDNFEIEEKDNSLTTHNDFEDDIPF